MESGWIADIKPQEGPQGNLHVPEIVPAHTTNVLLSNIAWNINQPFGVIQLASYFLWNNPEVYQMVQGDVEKSSVYKHELLCEIINSSYHFEHITGPRKVERPKILIWNSEDFY